MFEAVHGSAPDIAGKDVANPSGLLVAATQMLVHLGLPEVAEKIKNAWLCTLEDGIHTADIYREVLSTREVGTRAFAEAVIERLGRTPHQLEPVHYRQGGIHVGVHPVPRRTKELVGVDVFLDWDEHERRPNVLGATLTQLPPSGLALKLITNRGVKVFPEGLPETFCTDHWRCRFVAGDAPVTQRQVLALLGAIADAGLDIIKTEHLYTFDGERGYSLAQAE
jgi:isocitrate dehydrogenase